MAELLYRLGTLAARRARLVLTAWVTLLAVAGGSFLAFGGTLTNDLTIPGIPTQEVSDRLAAELPEAAGATGTVVLATEDGEPFDEAQREGVAALVAAAERVPGVEDVLDPFVTQAELEAQAEELTAGAAQLEQARADLAQGRAEVEQGRAEIEQGRQELAAAREQLEQGQAQLDAARAEAEAAGALAFVEPQLQAQQAQIDAGLAEVEVGEAALEAGAAEVEAGAAQVEAGEAEVAAGSEELALGTALLEPTSAIRFVSEDGATAIATVRFAEAAFDVAEETRDGLVDAFSAPVDGVRVDFSAEVTQGVPELLGIAEVVGLVVAAVVLVVMLGTLVGASLPLVTALVGVGIGALGALSLSGVVDMAAMTPVLGLMLGLAVGIDYSLFIVNRHRRQLKQGYGVQESIGLANGTSGNAVVFAGATVIIALLALNVTGIPFLGLVGTVAAACVAIAVLVATTLIPALLSLTGMRILSRRERAARTEGTASAGRAADPHADATVLPGVPTRPMGTGGAVLRVVGSVVVLAAIAVPALDLRLGLPDGSSEPADTTQYQAFTAVADSFGAGIASPLVLVADLPGSPSEREVLERQVQVVQEVMAQDDVVAVAPVGVSADRTTAVFQVVPAEGAASESTERLVHTLRDMSPLDGGIELGVAGLASGNVDVSDRLADALPTYLALVVGLSLLILLVVFRSVLVPLVATAGFILSFFAALGGVVAIYQWGWLGPLFGVDNPGPVLSFLPTLLVGILFGLAMDYMLFIGSGIREAYAHGAPARLAVVHGLHAGRAVVTAAAIIMVSVFGGFVFSHTAMIRPIGFALALGVLLDAFVVRLLLVPGFLHLVGDAAWWLPRWLDRLLPDVDVEGSRLERRHPHQAAAGATAGEPGGGGAGAPVGTRP